MNAVHINTLYAWSLLPLTVRLEPGHVVGFGRQVGESISVYNLSGPDIFPGTDVDLDARATRSLAPINADLLAEPRL